MPKVTLIDYTGKGHPDPLYAARLLAFTKNTRFSLTPGNWGAFRLSEPESNILDEMEYMAGTIPSSWEMVDLVFCIERMSRNTSLQLVRTRTGSYAMQSQRVTDMSEATWDTPKWTATKPTRNGVPGMFDRAMEEAVACYANEVAGGTPLEDARDRQGYRPVQSVTRVVHVWRQPKLVWSRFMTPLASNPTTSAWPALRS